MKRFLCVLLVLCLFLPAAFAMADDTPPGPPPQSAKDPSEFPNLYFGANPDLVFEYFKSGWSGYYSYSKEPVEENYALKSGTPITVFTFNAEEGDQKMPLTARFFFRKGTLVAAIQELLIPEGADASKAEKFTGDMLNNAKQGVLDLEKMDIFAEMLVEKAHLENGQRTWLYTLSVGEQKTNVILTMSVADGKVYLCEFLADKDDELFEKMNISVSLGDLKGFAELDGEKKSAVRLYVQYLMKQNKELLEQYIEFLKTAP